MNYSKNLRKAAMAKRVIILICIASFLGLVVGGSVGYTLKTHIIAKDRAEEEIDTSEQIRIETLVYGAYDDHYFTEELPLDWGAGDLDFTPLDCQMPEEHQEFVFYLCSGYNIDFTLVMAMIQQESSFNPSIVSKTHDYGYMQINIQNHEWLTKVQCH